MTAKVESKPPEGAAMPKGLRRKLVAIMGDSGWIEKDKRNAAQNYGYTSAESVAAAIRELMAKYGVDVEPDVLSWETVEKQTKSGGTMFYDKVLVGWTFTDVDSDEKVGPCRIPGVGMDSGDKGVYKAMTGSLKYALRMKFLLPFGDDPEETTEADAEVYGNGATKPATRTEALKGKVAAIAGKASAAPRNSDECEANVKARLIALGMKDGKARFAWIKKALPDFTGDQGMSSTEWAVLDGLLSKDEASQRQINDAAGILGAVQ